MRFRPLSLSLLAAAFASSADGQVQRITSLPPKAGPGTLVGFVVDSNGRAIDSAYVFIQSPRREARTDARGFFRFNGLPSNKELDLGVRKVGYEQQVVAMRLDKEGGAIRFSMPRVINVLPAVITEATRSGVFGLVTDASNKPLSGARVEVVASGAGAMATDSSGRFSLNAKPGRYMVAVSRRGFETKLTSISVPERGGRELLVPLVAILDPGKANREEARIAAMRDRLLMKWGPLNKLYTREELAKMDNLDMRQLASMATASRAEESCWVTVNGDAFEAVPIWAVNPIEFESIEVYAKVPPKAIHMQKQGVNSILGYTSSGMGSQATVDRIARLENSSNCPLIVAWARK